MIAYLPGCEPVDVDGPDVRYQVVDADVLVDLEIHGDIDEHGTSITVGRYRMTVDVARHIARALTLHADELEP